MTKAVLVKGGLGSSAEMGGGAGQRTMSTYTVQAGERRAGVQAARRMEGGLEQVVGRFCRLTEDEKHRNREQGQHSSFSARGSFR